MKLWSYNKEGKISAFAYMVWIDFWYYSTDKLNLKLPARQSDATIRQRNPALETRRGQAGGRNVYRPSGP